MIEICHLCGNDYVVAQCPNNPPLCDGCWEKTASPEELQALQARREEIATVRAKQAQAAVEQPRICGPYDCVCGNYAPNGGCGWWWEYNFPGT